MAGWPGAGLKREGLATFPPFCLPLASACLSPNPERRQKRKGRNWLKRRVRSSCRARQAPKSPRLGGAPFSAWREPAEASGRSGARGPRPRAEPINSSEATFQTQLNPKDPSSALAKPLCVFFRASGERGREGESASRLLVSQRPNTFFPSIPPFPYFHHFGFLSGR